MTKVRDIFLSVAAAVVTLHFVAFGDTGRAIAAAVQEVFVTNTANKPVWVRDVNEGRQPVAVQFTDPGGLTSSPKTIYKVPEGKRLVIEYVSGQIEVPQDQSPVDVTITTTVGGKAIMFRFPATSMGNVLGALDMYAVGEDTRLYADPETVVVSDFIRSSSSGNGYLRGSFSGYLVNVP